MSRAPVLLVTGASGFIGKHVIAALPGEIEIHRSRRREVPADGPGAWHRANLLDPAQCQSLIDRVRPSHLVHLAWTTAPGQFWNDPDNREWRVAGEALLAAFGRAGGTRAVIGGSCAEYPIDTEAPMREDAVGPEPSTIYGAAKHEFHRAATALAEEFGFALAWARIFTPYGVGEHAAKLIPSVINSLLDGKPARCTSGEQRRDFMDVRDLGAALAALTFSDFAGAINLGSGETATIADVARRIGDRMSSPELIAIGQLADRENEPPALVPDLNRMRRELGFAPEISLDDGLRDAIDWWTRARA